MSATMLELDAIGVAYPQARGERVVVEGLSLSLVRGTIGCLLGASGCGKTTVLRAIAGFEPLRAGRVLLGGRELSGPGASLPPERRGVGMMFQDYALFPHLDVAGNVGFGLARQPRAVRAARIAQMLDLVGLGERAGAYPHELSGGQPTSIWNSGISGAVSSSSRPATQSAANTATSSSAGTATTSARAGR